MVVVVGIVMVDGMDEPDAVEVALAMTIEPVAPKAWHRLFAAVKAAWTSVLLQSISAQVPTELMN